MEAKARILINEQLLRSRWRCFNDQDGPANVTLEAHVKLKRKVLGELRDQSRFEEGVNTKWKNSSVS